MDQNQLKSRPLDQLQDISLINRSSSRRFSENETANFDHINGRRVWDGHRHRPHKIYGDAGGAGSAIADEEGEKALHDSSRPNDDDTIKAFTSVNLSDSSGSLASPRTGQEPFVGAAGGPGVPSKLAHNDTFVGVEDEYIPFFNFNDSVLKWVNSYDSSGSSLSRISTNNNLANLHSTVDPVSVPNSTTASHAGLTPVRKRLLNKPVIPVDPQTEAILAQLPADYLDKSLSVRKKLLVQVAPPDADLQQLNKIIRSRFLKTSYESPMAVFNSVSINSKSSFQDSRGSVVLDHSLGATIGYGAWGTVRECYNQKEPYDTKAIKIIRFKNTKVLRFFKKEIKIWLILNHPNILPLYKFKETSDAIYCLTKRVFGGSLYDLVISWDQPGTTDSTTDDTKFRLIKKYSLDIVAALKYMHGFGIFHGDLKLENCLIDKGEDSGDGKLLLCDFGMSNFFKKIPASLLSLNRDLKDITDPNLPHSHIGSLPYSAPELLNSNPSPLGPHSDVWAFGVTLYTMIVGRLPFQHSYEPRLRAMISTGKFNLEDLVDKSNNNTVLIELVKGCLDLDVEQRLSVEEIETRLRKLQ